jgi:hypothetical protein
MSELKNGDQNSAARRGISTAMGAPAQRRIPYTRRGVVVIIFFISASGFGNTSPILVS